MKKMCIWTIQLSGQVPTIVPSWSRVTKCCLWFSAALKLGWKSSTCLYDGIATEMDVTIIGGKRRLIHFWACSNFGGKRKQLQDTYSLQWLTQRKWWGGKWPRIINNVWKAKQYGAEPDVATGRLMMIIRRLQGWTREIKKIKRGGRSDKIKI